MSSIHRIRLARVLVILGIVALGLAGRSALAAPARQSTTVEMQDFQFAPKTITIAPGTTVNWPNPGAAPHTTTSVTGLWDSGQKAPGESFAFTFTEPGTYAYYCTLHGTAAGVGMAGTVIVTAPAPPPPTATTPPPPPPTATSAPAPAAPTATTAPAAGQPQPTATQAPAGAAPAPTATTAPAGGGSGDPPTNLPTTGQSTDNSLLLGIAAIALAAGIILNRSTRRRTNSQ